ncbi:hypothetical protein J1614_004665 [Plenodomus biglobosus]|nr:hypothetical protein J1614_004665 [Plenodomus biglobosus]
MAGRILPIALATILGISIGVATFDGEFKEQRKRRLEEEYKREVASMASLQNASSSDAPIAVSPANSQQLPTKGDEVNASASSSSSWSSMLGLWAWTKDAKQMTASTTATSPPLKENVADSKGKP